LPLLLAVALPAPEVALAAEAVDELDSGPAAGANFVPPECRGGLPLTQTSSSKSALLVLVLVLVPPQPPPLLLL
jgi:hypothetical protein